MNSCKNKYSIVQVVDALSAGGAERVAVDTANKLSELGYISFLCATRASGQLLEFLHPGVIFFCAHRTSTWDWHGIYKFRSFIKSNSIEIVHAHGNSSAMFCVMSLIGLGRVIIHHDHNPILDFRKLWIERLLLRSVSSWICVSVPIWKWTMERVKYRRAVFIQNPVDTKRFKYALPLEKYRNGDLRMIVVANYKEHKDYLNLFLAINLKRIELTGCKFECYGGNVKSDYFRQLVSKKEKMNLEMLALYESSSRVPEILSKSLIGILPSSSEGLPISLLEYMAAGLPVVVTDVGECGTIVRGAKNGYVVEKENYNALGDAIVKIMNDQQHWNEMSENGIRYVHENYSLQSYIKKVLSEYEIAIKG